MRLKSTQILLPWQQRGGAASVKFNHSSPEQRKLEWQTHYPKRTQRSTYLQSVPPTKDAAEKNHISDARVHMCKPVCFFFCLQHCLQLLCQGLRHPYAAEVPSESQEPGHGRLPAQQAALRLGVAQLSPVSTRSCDCCPHHSRRFAVK